MIVRSIRSIRNVRYSEIIRVLYRMNCIIKIQKWWRKMLYYRRTNKQIDVLLLR